MQFVEKKNTVKNDPQNQIIYKKSGLVLNSSIYLCIYGL